jgi:hypothetical protein
MENQDKNEKEGCTKSTEAKKRPLFTMILVVAVIMLIGIYALNRCKGGTKLGLHAHDHVHEESAEQENN